MCYWAFGRLAVELHFQFISHGEVRLPQNLLAREISKGFLNSSTLIADFNKSILKRCLTGLIQDKCREGYLTHGNHKIQIAL